MPTRSASPASKLADKIYYKHTGYAGGIKEITAGKVLEGRFPERVLEKAIERMIPRGPLGRDQMRALHLYNGTEHPHGGQNPETLDVAAHEPQEQGGCLMSDNRQSLSDLAELTAAEPAAAPAPAPEAGEPAAPPPVAPQAPAAPLREQQLDKQGRAYATGRRKDAVARVWLKPGTGKITVNGRDQEGLFRPSDAAPGHQPGVRHRRPRRASMTWSPPSSAAASPARPARSGTASRQALTRYEPALRTHGQARRLPDPRPARRRAQEVRPRQGPPQLPVLEALGRDTAGITGGAVRKRAAPSFCADLHL